jgi:hypothetical protein
MAESRSSRAYRHVTGAVSATGHVFFFSAFRFLSYFYPHSQIAIMPARGQAEADIPAHQMCPEGTKVFVLCVGWLECDDGFLYRGGNTSLKSTENQSFVNKRTKFPLYVCLIDHPKAGLILWEVRI